MSWAEFDDRTAQSPGSLRDAERVVGLIAPVSPTERPTNEVALLLLLRMERHLLSFHILDQLADAFRQQLIRNPFNHPLVVRDLPVEFLALVAHGQAALLQSSVWIDDD